MKTSKIRSMLKPRKLTPLKNKDFLRTGSTLLDLGLSGRLAGGVVKGKYICYVGDSSSGKTWQVLQLFAEASINPEFDDYELIYDAPEEGALMDIRSYFGRKLAERLKPPAGTMEDPEYSGTIEEFAYNLDNAIKRGPCIYVLDSMDALTSDEEEAKFQERKRAYSKGREASGSYGMGKAKMNSETMRRMMRKIRNTGSILVVVSQVRDNVGFGAKFEPKRRSGGNALRFYATVEIWSSVKKRITQMVHGKKRQVGILVHLKIKKNRMSGKEWSVEFPLYYSYGIDDIGSCIAFLIEEKHWQVKGGKVRAPELDFTGPVDKLIRKIEDEGLQTDLRSVVGKVWREVEAACDLGRKPRYD